MHIGSSMAGNKRRHVNVRLECCANTRLNSLAACLLVDNWNHNSVSGAALLRCTQRPWVRGEWADGRTWNRPTLGQVSRRVYRVVGTISRCNNHLLRCFLFSCVMEVVILPEHLRGGQTVAQPRDVTGTGRLACCYRHTVLEHDIVYDIFSIMGKGKQPMGRTINDTQTQR